MMDIVEKILQVLGLNGIIFIFLVSLVVFLFAKKRSEDDEESIIPKILLAVLGILILGALVYNHWV